MTITKETLYEVLQAWLNQEIYRKPVAIRRMIVAGVDVDAGDDIEMFLSEAVPPAAAKAIEKPQIQQPMVDTDTKPMVVVDTPRGRMVECPICHELFQAQGLGSHKRRAHGVGADPNGK